MKLFSQILILLLCLYASTDFSFWGTRPSQFPQDALTFIAWSDTKKNTFPHVYYQNVLFSVSADMKYPVFFSLEKGEAYMQSELSLERGNYINLAFSFSEQAFVSPDLLNFSFSIPCIRKTKYIRLDSVHLWYAKDDTPMESLQISQETIPLHTVTFPALYAFETEEGRSGLLLLKYKTDEYVCMDIKMNKKL